MEEKTWCVYRHTFPNGKVYIGISCQPKERWDNGMGYAGNQPMFRDIVRYGWDNIKHEILYDGLTEDAAHIKEREMITEFGKEGREKTYNRTYADYERPLPKEWIELEITSESVRKYMVDFRGLNDEWIEPYAKRIGANPLFYRIEDGSLKLDFLDVCAGNRFRTWQCTIKFPQDHMTFQELYDWLHTAPEMVVDKEA